MKKVVAFYLPQYHRIPENDKWWGNGFTEWTNVKKAKKFFSGQYQPQIPLNNNYYNLLDKKTVEWQTEIANKYGVYGFCYFYYDFGTKKLLEKPAENLLAWTDIPQRFCFAWANVTWARTWKAIKGEHVTKWASDDKDDGQNGILIEQKYGDSAYWREHFMYLLPFFQDERYIKKDGKPMFLIYKLSHIPQAKEMFKLWNELARENGLPGLHIVSLNEAITDNPYVEAIAHYGIDVGLSQNFQAKCIRVGRRVVNKLMEVCHNEYRVPQIWDYKFCWKSMIQAKPYGNVPNYAGAFVNYDDTPRQGRKGIFLKDSSPELFEKYMTKQLSRAASVYHSEYVFLDAWNEWGEGNHLEPDEKNGYAYLEALRNALNNDNGGQ